MSVNEVDFPKCQEADETTPLMGEMDGPQKGGSTDVLVNKHHGKKYSQYIAAISATLGAFALGSSLAWTSPIAMKNGTYIDDLMINMTAQEKIETWSWIGALMPLGAALVSLIIGHLIEKIGRKIPMLLLVIPFTIGWALIIWPKNIEMIYAGRILLGMAGGAIAVAAPVYTSEIAQKEIRGALGSYFQLMVTMGILFVYIIGGQVPPKILSIACGVVPLVFGFIFFFMPESPEYLVANNKFSEALTSLQFLRSKECDVCDELVTISENIAKSRNEKLSVIEAFKTKAAKKSMFISLCLMFIQQLSGVNAVIFYAGDIFAEANKGANPNISSIIVGVVQVVSTFASTLMVDRLGRKILLLISSSVMFICALLLGLYFYLRENQKDVSSISWLPLISLCFFMISFSIGFGPIPWMILGELFHPSIKGIASSIACCFNWVWAFLVTKFYAPISEKEGRGVTFFIFTSILACGTIFVIFFVKETKGKTSEEIQNELNS